MTDEYSYTTMGVSKAECKSCEDENTGRKNRRDKKTIANPNGTRLNGLLCWNADPRFAGLGDNPSGGDVVLTTEQVRERDWMALAWP